MANIDDAWHFFKHHTLPRRVLKEGATDDFRKLEPGEDAEGSTLYGVWVSFSVSIECVGDASL